MTNRFAWIALSFGCAVAAQGCHPPPQPCGGIAGLGCDDGQFCNFAPETQCGSGDQQGVCEAVPDVCNEIFAPVCGCDGQTYDNECFANAAGLSVLHEGPCESDPGRACGGFAGLTCDAGEFCNFPIDAQCGAADQQGVCEAVPDACIEIFAPVCGCDDKTYDNACFAHAAGVSVAREGACEPAGVSCDPRTVLCDALEPKCPDFQVPQVVGGCWGPCVPIDACVCDEAADCPHEEGYTCHMYRNRCGPYVN